MLVTKVRAYRGSVLFTPDRSTMLRHLSPCFMGSPVGYNLTLYIHIFSDFGYPSSPGHPRGPTARFITPDDSAFSM